ncbi:ATP-binding cassette domain-containing protein [Paenibacillus humicus]|uniref:ATP-binding cassette domain-containing protein n=1 Tax=Paenibacillus humicus TaxID=412861 RepID=UPI003F15D66C
MEPNQGRRTEFPWKRPRGSRRHCRLVGRSGSGKSTLLRMLRGLDIPSGGQVIAEAKFLFDMEEEERTVFRRRRIGFEFQQFNLFYNRL